MWRYAVGDVRLPFVILFKFLDQRAKADSLPMDNYMPYFMYLSFAFLGTFGRKDGTNRIPPTSNLMTNPHGYGTGAADNLQQIQFLWDSSRYYIQRKDQPIKRRNRLPEQYKRLIKEPSNYPYSIWQKASSAAMTTCRNSPNQHPWCFNCGENKFTDSHKAKHCKKPCRCEYPLCLSKNHCTMSCRVMLGFCTKNTCERRGHNMDHHQQYDFPQLDALVFE